MSARNVPHQTEVAIRFDETLQLRFCISAEVIFSALVVTVDPSAELVRSRRHDAHKVARATPARRLPEHRLPRARNLGGGYTSTCREAR